MKETLADGLCENTVKSWLSSVKQIRSIGLILKKFSFNICIQLISYIL